MPTLATLPPLPPWACRTWHSCPLPHLLRPLHPCLSVYQPPSPPVQSCTKLPPSLAPIVTGQHHSCTLPPLLRLLLLLLRSVCFRHVCLFLSPPECSALWLASMCVSPVTIHPTCHPMPGPRSQPEGWQCVPTAHMTHTRAGPLYLRLLLPPLLFHKAGLCSAAPAARLLPL